MPTTLNPRYTFSGFVLGKSNEAAYAAASAAAVAPGTLYNPILITGETGLGKTHLAHAVGTEAQRRGDRVATVLTADEFLRLLSAAVSHGGYEGVIRELTASRLLVLDDVHVLDRHAAAQDALGALAAQAVSDGVQLLLTSDSAAGADVLASRLVRRFRSAHVATLGTPDWSQRVAILHAKARLLELTLPPSVAHHIAAQSGDSIRELEGKLTRLVAIASLGESPLTLALARRAVPSRQRDGAGTVGAQAVQEAVAAEWGISPEALVGPGRARALSEPRRIGMLLCRDRLELSLREIGSAFGDRDVSTVMSALSRARADIADDAAIALRVARLCDVLPALAVALKPDDATAPSPQ